jgi:beta-galactosidase
MKLSADFVVPYAPGCIKAVAYGENGNIVAEAERRSFGDAVRLETKQTRVGELVFVEIYAVDINGNPVENANNRVNVTVRNGKLLGLDNGDSTDYDPYKGNSKRLFGGKLLAIVKPGADSEILVSTKIDKSDAIPNANGKTLISVEMDKTDIPIRKIELHAEGNTVTASLFPANATYSDLQWRLTDDAGIDSPLGSLIPDGLTATLVPKGDGEVYIRCATENGKGFVGLISLLPLTFSGYGTPFLDPYSFVSGGLYTASNVPMTNGNERGVATLRDGESHIGFAGLDFGSYGADEITLWLFPLGGNSFPIEIWQGKPTEGRHLCTVTYDKGSVWNTYKEVTYQLPERLRGVQTLSFVFRQKVHMKGFRFATVVKAYQQLRFTANDNIYGDSFTVTENNLERIGNNVTITFNGMDFEDGAGYIEIAWQATQNNTIRIVHV